MNADELARVEEQQRDFDADVTVLLVEFWEIAAQMRARVGDDLTRAQALGRVRGALSKTAMHLLERAED